MSTTSLVAEFIVAGIVPFLALVFGTLAVFHVRDLTALATLKDYSTLVTLLLTLVIYFLGALLHRLSQYADLLAKALSIGQPDQHSPEEYYGREAYFYQHAAGPLIQRVEYEKSLERVFGSTTFSLALLGISLCFWVREAAGLPVALASLAICLVLAVLAGLSYLRQRKNRHALTGAFLKLENYPPRDHKTIDE